MIVLDEDALICDFAETYHIYDYRQIPASTAATLACGLRPDSRIKLKMANKPIGVNEMLLAGIIDRLSILIWQNTKDAANGVNFPESMLGKMLGRRSVTGEVEAYESAEDFEAARREVLGGINGK